MDSGTEAANAAKALFEACKKTFGRFVPGLEDLEFEQLGPMIIDYLKAHPYMTSFQVVMLLVTAVPGLVATPALLAMGFGPLGPVAGHLAPAFQAARGTPWLFRACQSAAMGGWGTAIVNGVTQAGAVTAGFLAQLAKGGNGTETPSDTEPPCDAKASVT